MTATFLRFVFPTDRSIFKRILTLALPVILANMSRTFMTVVDVAMVGRLGAEALAAVGLGGVLVWTILSIGVAFRTGVQTVTARRYGQQRFEDCGQALNNGLALASVVGLLLAGAELAWSQLRTEGEEITRSRILVNQGSHWSHWSMPTHAVDLVDDRVEFHYFRGRFNVMEDHATYQRDIPALDFRDKFKDHKGMGALHSVETVGRRFTYDDTGELRLRSDLKMDKYLDRNFLKYPGNEAHVVFDGELYAITDTAMSSAKEGVLTLRNVETDQASSRDFQTKDKNAVPVYQYFLSLIHI